MAALRALAKLHACYFNRVRAKGLDSWLLMMDDPRLKFAVNIYPQKCDKFIELAQGYYGATVTPEVKRLMTCMKDNIHVLHSMTGTSPKEKGGCIDMTLCHGDFRLPNIFLMDSSDNNQNHNHCCFDYDN